MRVWTRYAFPLLPALALLVIWETWGRKGDGVAFFFSYPSAIGGEFLRGIGSGELLIDAAYTLAPALAGLAIGAVVGGGVGFALIYNIRVAQAVTSYVTVLGAVPIFAIAPMALIWFGIGLGSKVFLAFLSTVFVFLSHAHHGGLKVPERLVDHFTVHKFTSSQEFFKLRLPFAADWLFSALKININFALLGVFLGEFMAAERGLGRVMLNASGVYRVDKALSAALGILILSLVLTYLANLVFAHRWRLLHFIGARSIRVTHGS